MWSNRLWVQGSGRENQNCGVGITIVATIAHSSPNHHPPIALLIAWPDYRHMWISFWRYVKNNDQFYHIWSVKLRIWKEMMKQHTRESGRTMTWSDDICHWAKWYKTQSTCTTSSVSCIPEEWSLAGKCGYGSKGSTTLGWATSWH